MSNDDYIRRDDAIRWNPASKDRREYGTFNLDDAYETGYEDKIKQIEQIPAADVRNNIHGVWIYHISDIFPAESTKECSICHAEQCISCDDEFCPHCGADMRGKNDEV